MHTTMKRLVTALVMLTAATALSACGNLSHDVSKDGSGAGKLVWPSPDDTTPIHAHGTWPTLDSLRQIHAGMTKNQLMALVGPPHFNEGIWGVREWDYLFHLRDPRTGQAHVCEYKALFDTDGFARSFYWHPAGCAAYVHPKPVVEKPQTVLTVTALFAFDQSGLDDINPEGRAQLRQIVEQLKERVAGGNTVEVDGYAGPIGSETYNQILSQKRAETVRTYLISQGVPADAIDARGYGVSRPVAHCEGLSGTALRACYGPDRRVEIVVNPKR